MKKRMTGVWPFVSYMGKNGMGISFLAIDYEITTNTGEYPSDYSRCLFNFGWTKEHGLEVGLFWLEIYADGKWFPKR